MRALLFSMLFLAVACSDGSDDPGTSPRPDSSVPLPDGSDGSAEVPDASDGSADASDVADGDVAPLDAADAAVEKRCGETPETYDYLGSPDAIARFAGCTTLVGHFQQDSVSAIEDFSGLESVRKIEGTLNVFRSPGFRTLRGLDNLEVVEGNLFIHMNDNLTTIAALAKLHTVTGNLNVTNNDLLPQAEVEAFGARVTVGGEKVLQSAVVSE